MNWFFIICFFTTVGYLYVQTKEDKKTKTVYTALNNGMMLFTALIYLVRCFVMDFPVVWTAFLYSLLFLVLHFFFFYRMMGIGDAKALVVFFLQSGLLFQDGTFDVLFPVFIYFLANVFFTVVIIFSGLKKKKKIKEILFGKERKAFFPFLFPSYILCSVLWSFTYGVF